MSKKLITPGYATEINPEEAHALIPNISTQSELNQYERENIRKAMRWATTSKLLKKDLLSLKGIRTLHKKMFCDVWEWAGEFRTTEKNIGNVLAYQVSEEVLKLCDDFKFRLKHEIKDWELFAVEFHYRLVTIHPFSNGNGRCARLAADLLLQFNGRRPLLWGASDFIGDEETRQSYVASLKTADRGNIQPLYKFATRTKY